MKITCTKPYITHYGRMLIQGEEYEISRVFKRKTQIITDYDNHWKYVGLIADSLKWLRLGYTPDNMREVIPEYITISEMERLTTKSVLIPFAEIITSGSKIKRLEDMCWCYVSTYDRKYVIPDLQKKLESGLINQKKYDREMEGTKDRIRIDILQKEEIELTVAEKRDDTLTDILS